MDVLEQVLKNRALLIQILGNQSDLAHMILHAAMPELDKSTLTDVALRIVQGTQRVLEPT